MALIRLRSENQRQFVERTLLEKGNIQTYDALYATTYPDGKACAITRLASRIRELREDGWQIGTIQESGKVASYVLRGRAIMGRSGALQSTADSGSIRVRLCPSCNSHHPAMTTCTGGWQPWKGEER